MFFLSHWIEENFDYSTGDLISSSDWEESPGGSKPIQVISGNLSYTGYPSSSIGNKIFVDGGADGRSGNARAFTSQSGNGSVVYASFLVGMVSTEDMDINTSDGDRFFNLKVSGSSASRACVFVKQGSTSEKFQIGLGKLSGSTPEWYSTELDINVVYLIVVAYVFQSGDDVARLWINPDLTETEPIADLEQTTGSDASDIGEVQFRQEPLSGDEEIDGLRVATSWAQAPLPVELTSFTASASNEQIRLNWETSTELNNFGFEVERLIGDSNLWKKIGFVEGHGNSNSPKEYSFSDRSVYSGKYAYRLKQIDTDGKFKYSSAVEVNLGAPSNFGLSQNYPNPFNPSTTIKFGYDKNTEAQLKVYDVLGNEVVNLFNGVAEGGKVYQINFDGSALSSGVYYYKLTCDNKTEIKKMMLLK